MYISGNIKYNHTFYAEQLCESPGLTDYKISVLMIEVWKMCGSQQETVY